jgi:hypothetical protein
MMANTDARIVLTNDYEPNLEQLPTAHQDQG